MKRHYFTYSSNKPTQHERIDDCIQAYKAFTRDMGMPIALRCTFFTDARDNEQYDTVKSHILSKTSGLFLNPAVVGQPPVKAGLAMECVIVDQDKCDIQIQLRSCEGHAYLVLEKHGAKKLYATSLCGDLNTSIKDQSIYAFELAEKILQQEGLSFSDVIRQWNYIENITQTVVTGDTVHQHYQIFNDIRSMFYAKADFINGYPAATGIGMDTGGVMLEIIAGKGDHIEIVPIDNPEQVSAHRYSENVLVGKEIEEVDKKTTPKFERAKFVNSDFGRTLFISGTAAIRGENTIPSYDIIEQTRITIQNIQQLEYNGSHDHDYSMFRLYVKDPSDGPASLDYSKTFFGNIPCLALKGPVCRDNLVVEIEAEKAF